MTEDRIVPKKIRVTKLQEAQLVDLMAIEARCAQMFYEVGYGDDEIRPRSEFELARLTRNHDILVAEADHQPAGFLVWADQAPGVAWLPTLEVAPAFQRFGIGTRLLRDLGETAHGLGVEMVVTPCWERAAWAMAFLGVRGFAPVDGGPLPEPIASWKEAHAAELAVVPGQKLWWAKSDGLGTIPGLPRPH
jgi:amino-acid N-acetyltransferase